MFYLYANITQKKLKAPTVMIGALVLYSYIGCYLDKDDNYGK